MHLRCRALVVPLLLLAACETTSSRTSSVRADLPTPSAPIALAGTGYETAEIVKLPETKPGEWSDLHNVFHLSDDIISGSEPHGDAAMKRIAEMGVKTLLSVDGKVPDAAAAQRYGMRYVHVPIQYSGVTDAEIADIAKTFRELPGPFYVHCFHGKHRGPAGAAVGRIVLDGASREEALAEMRQWCGTSPKYEGLYRDIATRRMPSAAETAAIAFDFPAAHRFEGTREAMIEMARHWDNLVDLGKRDWATDPENPDLDARNEAQKIHGLFTALVGESGFAKEPDDFRGWMHEAFGHSERLAAQVAAQRGGDTAAGQAAQDTMKSVKKLCDTCHSSYRD